MKINAKSVIPNVTLKRGNLDDVQYIYELENNPKNFKYSALNEAPYSFAEIRLFCKQCELISYDSIKSGFSDYLRLVVLLDNNIKVGILDIYDINIAEKSAWISIIIYPEKYRSSGIAAAALEALVSLCRNELGLEILYSEVDKNNKRSLKFFENQGFKPTPNQSQAAIIQLSISINQ